MDIIDDLIPSKLTLSLYSIWRMKCRYDPKYDRQYKSNYTKYVKLSKKVLKPLDTQKYYPNREWPRWLYSCFRSSSKDTLEF